MEVDEIDELAAAVLGDFQEIFGILETTSAPEIVIDIGQRDLPDGVHFDVAPAQPIPSVQRHVRPLPNPHGACSPAPDDAIVQALGEQHGDDPSFGSTPGALRVVAEFPQFRDEAITVIALNLDDAILHRTARPAEPL